MLTACAGSQARPALTEVPALNPIIETREVVVRQCPAALASPRQPQPTPRADAVVEFNPAGGDWLAEVLAWGAAGWRVAADAAADCTEIEPD